MGLEYVDIFYSHRPDPATPLEETMGALDQAVRSGKALYAGISSYNSKSGSSASGKKGHGAPERVYVPVGGGAGSLPLAHRALLADRLAHR